MLPDRQLGQQAMYCSRRTWQQVLANTLQYSCLENLPETEKSTGLQESSAPVRIEQEGGSAAWLAGTLAAQSVQGHALPLPQEL